MVSQKVTIKNPTGLHVRPAGVLCQKANCFQCKIHFTSGNGNISNAKSLLSVLGSGVKYGDEIEFVCDGVDETEALEMMILVVENGLEE